jgi:hypothetical protein
MIPVRKIALAGALAVATGAAFAGTARADTFWDRLRNQQDRIEQGVDNSNLTPSEARRLEEQEHQLARERHRLAENGLSERAREILKRDENRESRRIYDLRHNDARADRDWGDRGNWGWSGGDRGRDWRTADHDDHDHHHHNDHDHNWDWR